MPLFSRSARKKEFDLPAREEIELFGAGGEESVYRTLARSFDCVIRNVIVPAGIPAIVGEEGICAGCGIATLSISYEDLGRATGKMAAKILFEGEDVSAMDVQFAEATTKEYNAEICEELGITAPDDYVAIGGESETEAE
jgi:ABC-type uncharacterized transport system substrate-binding protein